MGSNKKAQSTGVGESKVFAAPEGTFEQTHDWSQLTLNGQPIPEELWGTMLYRLTDQGAAEFNAGKEPRRVEILRTEESKRIERFGDLQFDSGEPGLGDPMKELVDRYVKPGEHPRFLSERAFQTHGRRGYSQVMDEHGKPVKFGDMPLGVIPKDEAVRREQRDAAISKQMLVQAEDKVRENNEEVMSDRKLRSLAKKRGVSEDVGGMQTEEVVEHEFA